jgi:hypothetical protein
MLQVFRKLGIAVIGSTLVALLSLTPAAAQGGYGGGYGSMGGYSSGNSYGNMSGHMSMGGYGQGYSSGSYGSHSMPRYGSSYGSSGMPRYGNSYGSSGTPRYGNTYGYNNSYAYPSHARTTFYRVHFGDTLSRIAARFGTSVGAILGANPRIYNPNLIFAGMPLWVPVGSMHYGSTYGGSTYGGSMYGSGY